MERSLCGVMSMQFLMIIIINYVLTFSSSLRQVSLFYQRKLRSKIQA